LPTAARRGARRTTVVPYPRVADLPCPGGRGAGFPVRWADPASDEPEAPSLRGDPVSLARWNAARGAPRSSACVVPVRLGSRRPEGCRLPGPVRSGVPAPGWELLAEPPRRAGLRFPVGVARRASEEVRSALPGGVGCRRPRRAGGSLSRGVGCRRPRGAGGSLSRWAGGPSAPRGRGFPDPVEPCSRRPEGCRLRGPGEARRAAPRGVPFASPRGGGDPSRWNGVRGAPRSSGCPVPVGWGWSWPGWTRSAEPPRWSDFALPVGWGAVGPEGLAVPCPGEARLATLRGVSSALPRRFPARGAPRGAVCLAPRGSARGPPKSAVCLAPGGPGARPRGGGGLWPGWNGVAGPPRRSGLPVPVGWGADGPEGPLVPCPDGMGGLGSEEPRFPVPVRLGAR
jgi:hypothetical protein